MKRAAVLLIAYHFPPDEAIGGARVHRFYKYLKRLGYRCHVLTAASQTGHDPDIECVPDPVNQGRNNGLLRQLERVLWKFVIRQDLRLPWSKAVWKAGRKFLNSIPGEPVIILSSVPPLGPHLAAMRLANYRGCAWIADFRDPIASPAGESPVLGMAPAEWTERHVLQRASLILANTDAMRDLWVRRYRADAEKIHVLWNGFDPEDAIPIVPPPAGARRIITHTGELYGGRDIRPVLRSVERLIAQGRLPREHIRIRQIGPVDPAEMPDAEMLRSATGAGWLEMVPPVSGATARERAIESDGLLLLQPQSAVQVPGKLFEYVRMGRPILAFIARNSPIERILRQSGVPCEFAYPDQTPGEMDECVLRFLELAGPRSISPSKWFLENFSAPGQVGTLSGLMDGLLSSP